jgi:hypothetical protein
MSHIKLFKTDTYVTYVTYAYVTPHQTFFFKVDQNDDDNDEK